MADTVNGSSGNPAWLNTLLDVGATAASKVIGQVSGAQTKREEIAVKTVGPPPNTPATVPFWKQTPYLVGGGIVLALLAFLLLRR